MSEPPLLQSKRCPPLHFLTYADFVADALVVSEQILQKKEHWDVLLSINRGGAVLSRLLSDLLGDIPILAFAMKSYKGINEQGGLVLTQALAQDLRGKRVIIVDEICDTGATFEKAIEYIKFFHPETVATATLITKPHSTFTPDFSSRSVAAWVVFPYDVLESLRNLVEFWSVDPVLKEQLLTHFASLGITRTWLEKAMLQIKGVYDQQQ